VLSLSKAWGRPVSVPKEQAKKRVKRTLSVAKRRSRVLSAFGWAPNARPVGNSRTNGISCSSSPPSPSPPAEKATAPQDQTGLVPLGGPLDRVL
jgi:hypothetical protein